MITWAITPLYLHGSYIGEATLTEDEIALKITNVDVMRELQHILLMGMCDGLSISPNYLPAEEYHGNVN